MIKMQLMTISTNSVFVHFNKNYIDCRRHYVENSLNPDSNFKKTAFNLRLTITLNKYDASVNNVHGLSIIH